ncbi:methionyl-tRNA formyltransferase [Aureliella helgolandensis]|uniref:Methionyl-tRNA formyltransferase n=1 Tax=Aureliella helgolandensis TaxID=2527968 RepID=A0A518GA37_9BACT|nr:methionyl-tRNA formyltransferase [Aureliella helgolandensis]QDV25433.1 Methionyl-tRNA formyltransferase [Aureliella helgolandensis]
MRIVVMGTGPFAVPTCVRLLQDGHDVPLVVTRPAADARAKKAPPRPVYEWAKAEGIEVFEPASINSVEAIERVAAYQADLFFVCDYGQILSDACLGAARLGGINLHGSILPRHRGAAPVQWALLRGDQEAGITVIHMTPRLDAGPALESLSTLIRADETAGQLEPRLAELGVDATVAAVRTLEGWDGEQAIGMRQDKTQVTKAPRFSKADGQLDFRLPGEYLVRLVRACQPWPGTFGVLTWGAGKSFRIQIRGARWSNSVAGWKQLEPGGVAVVEAEQVDPTWEAPWDRMLGIQCQGGVLLVGLLQPAGKREMFASEFLRGHPLDESTRMTLPEVPLSTLD